MKKITFLLIIVMAFLSLAQTVNAVNYTEARRSFKKIEYVKEPEREVPQLISDLSLLDPLYLNIPKTYVIDNAWRYECFKTYDNTSVTMIWARSGSGVNCGPYYLAGEFYYDIHQELFIPFGDEVMDSALRFKPTNNGLIVYGNVIDESLGMYGIIERPQIVEGNATLYLRTAKRPMTGGMPGIEPDYYYYNALIPANMVDLDGWDLHLLLPGYGYQPGQNGVEFNLNGNRCLARYYSFIKSDNTTTTYTNIKILNTQDEIWIEGIFLYDVSNDAFYIHDGTDGRYSLKLKYINGFGFYITCGSLCELDTPELTKIRSKALKTRIRFAFEEGFPMIYIGSLEGLPLFAL